MTEGEETLTVQYVSQVEGQTTQEIRQNYLALLEKSLEKDFQLRHTSVGCQRDDVMLKINDVDVRNFGSQGQQRTVALSLKLSELQIFKQLTGEYPVLLLDDVLSELDLNRQKRLLNFDSNLQILLTTATPLADELATKCKTFQIVDGVCTETK